MNLWAVLVAAVSSFLLGGAWYSKALFGAVWCKESGVVEQSGHPARVFAVSFGFALLAAACFGWWLGPDPGFLRAVGSGLLVGLGFVGASFGINYQFANRSWTMLAVDAGYHGAQFAIFGLVLGLWP